MQILNCYLEPGLEQFQAEKAKKVTDIIKDIIKQDEEGAKVVRDDFNNQIPQMNLELHYLGFSRALDHRTITHNFGRHHDQVFARGVDITNAYW
jgi:hypothetical protein